MKSADRTKPLAIVMGRQYATRLTLARSAGMVGCDVVLIHTDRLTYENRLMKIDKSSKYVKEYLYSPQSDEKALVDTILGYCNKKRKVVLLPADDWVASVIDRYHDLLSPHCLLPNIHNRQGEIIKLMDKFHQKGIAKRIGLHVAKGWLCNVIDGEYQIPDGVTYPCFTKPQESYSGHLKAFLRKCNSESELRSTLNKISKVNKKTILIEEYIEIEKEYGVQGMAIKGVCVAPSAIEKGLIRQGMTATGKIFPIDRMPELEEKLNAFLKETSMTGIFDMEFYESKGVLYFNEFNVRLGANGFAVTYGVANIPGLYVKYMLGDSGGNYNGPIHFEEQSFASEKVLRDLFFDKIITYKQYKKTISKDAEILCIKNELDNKPFKVFSKIELILPFWRWCREAKRKMKN